MNSKGFLFVFICICGILYVNGQEIKKGLKAPDFKLYDLEGNVNTLENYKGKVVVIKMWFKGCTPCLQEIPKVNRLVEKYKNQKDIIFIAPALNNKHTLDKFIEKVNFNYIVMYNSYEMLKKYNPSNRYPSHAIIDKNGIVSFMYEGTSETIDNLLEKEIEKVL